ncbi:MAG: hypothetical protein AAFR47_02470 [Pseudomonadota bacterium]
MAKHILDRSGRVKGSAPVVRYARAARVVEAEGVVTGVAPSPRVDALRRRTKGRYVPGARLKAYLRIDRRAEI